jgi:hypothetical protein
MTDSNHAPKTASRRHVWQAMTSLVAVLLGLPARSGHAQTCAARGSACSILQPCCAGSRCRWLDHNLFVGVCSGGRATPAGVPVKAGRVSGRWSTPAGNVTCDDFDSRRDARHYLRRTGDRDEVRLDPNGNGIPCESLPRK